MKEERNKKMKRKEWDTIKGVRKSEK